MDKTTKILGIITLVFAIAATAGFIYLKSTQTKPVETANTTVDKTQKAPTGVVDLTKEYTATISTTKGNIKLQLYPKDAPMAVENFVKHSKDGYYNGLIFHRISKNFVIQGGDPLGTGSGGKSIYGKYFQDELNANTESYKAGYVKGVLAMANSGENTNGSQFFIMLEDKPELPKNYTIFGKVIEGQDVVDAIGQVDLGPSVSDGKPLEDIKMNTITIEEK